MSLFLPTFLGAPVNATVLTLLLKSFAEKKRSSLGVSANIAVSCIFSPLRFLVADGITDFGIAQAKHCNLVFCSFVLQLDWLKSFLTEHALHAITCGVNGLTSFIRFICLWCNTRIVAIARKVYFHHKLPLWRNKGRSSAAATSRRCTKLRYHWYYTATTARLALACK